MGSQRVGHNWVTSLWLDGDVDSTAFAARILLPALRRTIFHLCGYLWGWLWILGRQSLLHSLRGCLYVFMPYMSFCPWGILLTAEWVSFCMRSYKAGIVVFPVCIFNLHNVIWYISFCFLLFFPPVNTTSLVYFHIAIGCFECVNNSPGCPSTTSYLSFFQDLSTPCYHKWCCHGYPCFSSVQFSSVQSLSHVWLFATPWTAAHQASLSITNSQSLPKLMSIDSVMPSNHLILCCPPLLLPSIFPASGSFPVSQLFESGGQSIGVSASISVLPMNTQDWSPLGWTGWIFLQSKGLTRAFSNTTVQKHHFFSCQISL